MSIACLIDGIQGGVFADGGRLPTRDSVSRGRGKPLSQSPEVRALGSQRWRRACAGRQPYGRASVTLIGNGRYLRACGRVKLGTDFLAVGSGRRSLHAQRDAGYREVGGSPWSPACSAKEEFPPYVDIDGDAMADERRRFEYVVERDLATKEVSFLEEGYIGLFVRLLGLDNSAEDREASVRALWKHSMGGKQCVDDIMEFPGCLALIVRLLSSDRAASSEAAAGLLRSISMINAYRSDAANAGAIEEITGILTRRSICSQVREQATCVLWNLSVEEKWRHKIANAELLPVLIAMLGSPEEGETEAAAGVLANLALSECNHDILVEAGAIPKMANLLKDTKFSKVTRQEARNALLELVKDKDKMLYFLEEGLVPVPLIGASAYQSFKPLLDVAPALPEDVKVEMSSLPSAFGAQELLLGLNIGRRGYEIDDATQLAIEGRVRQHFLARVGVLEKKMETKPEKDCKTTLMPWWDGIPRLVLILGLEDVTVAKLAADTISDIAVTEEMRQAVHKAGAVPHLVRLLGCGDEAATESAASALENLSISYKVRKSIDAHGAVPALVAVLKADDSPLSVRAKVVSALAWLSQTGEEMKAMIRSGSIPGLVDIVESMHSTSDAKAEAEDILEEMSVLKADSRDIIVVAGGVPPLIQFLQSGNPSQKEKAACVLENLATKEPNAECIVNLGVEYALKATFEVLGMEEENDIRESCAVCQSEETWCAVAAASRLLNKLLRFEKIRDSLNCKYFAISLANILKTGAPLYVKDWISACLFKLERLAGISRSVGIPIDLEITVHDIIPRLITEIETTSSGVQERAAVQLRDLILMGMPDYITAISDSGGIFPLVELLDKGTPRAREAALAVLYNLCMNGENHSTILAAGAVTHLERLVRSGGSQWKLALYLLRALPT